MSGLYTCSDESGITANSTTLLAANLLGLFEERIDDLYNSSRDIMETYLSVRASMFQSGLTITDLEAKALELGVCVDVLEVKRKEVDELVRQIDPDVVSNLMITLRDYRHLTEAQAKASVLEYREDVRLRFHWMRPLALCFKRALITIALEEIKEDRFFSSVAGLL